MDDFLHNLRTGKNKNYDRNRRNFDAPAFKGDRPGKDKSKTTAAQALSPEVITDLTVTLKDIAESFSRVAEAGEGLARLALRQTQLLEQVLEALQNKPHAPGTCPGDPATAEVLQAYGPDQDLEVQREALKARIKAWYADGLSFKKIAARLSAEGEATLSGKGHWHGRSVSRIINDL